MTKSRARLLLALGLGLLAQAWVACVLAGHKSGGDSPSPAPSGVPAGPATPLVNSSLANTDVVAYAQSCKAALGLGTATLPPWNCLEGLEIPVTVAGQALNPTNYAQLTTHQVGCDHPSWLGSEPCANYAFVTHRTLAPNVEAYLICRDQVFTTYKSRAQRLADLQASPSTTTFDAYFSFGSLGMIWSNTATGATCFFDYVGQTYGGYVPSPDDASSPTFNDLPDPKPPTEYTTGQAAVTVWQKGAETTWRTPPIVAAQDQCVLCHDTGPFKSSPWMQQVLTIPSNPQNVPMLVVGDAFNVWKTQFPLKAISTAPVTVNGQAQPQICTTCHRIGSQSTCGGVTGFPGSTLKYAIGTASPQLTGTAGLDFAHRTWMPPPPASWAGKSDTEMTNLWNAAYSAHVTRLECCCQNPQAINCTSQDMTTSPLPDPVAGTGPAICN